MNMYEKFEKEVLTVLNEEEKINIPKLEKILSEHFNVLDEENFLDLVTYQHQFAIEKDVIILFEDVEAYMEAINILCEKYRIYNPSQRLYNKYDIVKYIYENDKIAIPVFEAKRGASKKAFTIGSMNYTIIPLNGIIYSHRIEKNLDLFVWRKGTSEKILNLKEILEAEREEVLSRKISEIENVCEAYGITPEQFEELREKVYNIKHQYEAEGIKYEEGV